MISPSSMKIIQIEVTNSCIHHCSNCTRFCGLHEKTFMMSLEQFRNAVDSLRDFPGIVGVMGGEPTLNPQFPEMIGYLHQVRGGGKKSPGFVRPVRDFNRFHQENWNELGGVRQGLWSALGKRYYENLESISDIFPYQCLNDHKNAGLHQALLLPRKELGISDEEWYPLRDRCWIQNEWSASITPKGAFFCEIAAALDMLFDGPGGWKVEPGWWKRTPEEFGEQLNWCEFCSAALAVPRIEGNLETDIISPKIWEKLKNRKVWKVANNRCMVFDTAAYRKEDYLVNHSGMPYLSGKDMRVSQDTSGSLYPHDIAVLTVNGAEPPHGENIHPISSGSARQMEFPDWLLIVRKTLPAETVEYIRNAVFNPGVLYYGGNTLIFLNRKALALKNCPELPLELNLLKKLYPAKKRYSWSNWRTPDRPGLAEKMERLKHRLKDSFAYRSRRLLEIIGLR